MRKGYLLIIAFTLCLRLSAQNNVGIGTPAPDVSSLVEMKSTDKGLLIPRMTSVQRRSIYAPAQGLLVYDITDNCFYYFDGVNWISLCQMGGTAGTTGATGAQGIPGIAGATGATGVMGTQGVTGPTGLGSICNSAITNQVAKFTSDSAICNSIITDDGTNVGIGNLAPTEKLDVTGNVKFSGALMPNNLPGSTGQVLTSQGPGIAPVWQTGVTDTTTAYSVSAIKTAINSTNYTNVGGLTQTITLTVNSIVFITTWGALETFSASSGGGSTCRVGLFNGNTPIAEQTVDNLNNFGFIERIQQWSMNTFQILGPGTYTFTVQSKEYVNFGSGFYAGGSSTGNPNEGMMSILVFPH